MQWLIVLADMLPLPFLIGGGLVLIVVCGCFVSLAVLLVSGILRRRNLRKTSTHDEVRKE